MCDDAVCRAERREEKLVGEARTRPSRLLSMIRGDEDLEVRLRRFRLAGGVCVSVSPCALPRTQRSFPQGRPRNCLANLPLCEDCPTQLTYTCCPLPIPIPPIRRYPRCRFHRIASHHRIPPDCTDISLGIPSRRPTFALDRFGAVV